MERKAKGSIFMIVLLLLDLLTLVLVLVLEVLEVVLTALLYFATLWTEVLEDGGLFHRTSLDVSFNNGGILPG